MTSPYVGDPDAFPESFSIPDNADPEDATSVDVALEALGDRTAFLKKYYGAMAALTFQTSVGTSNSFNVLKYSEALARWFACASTPTEYIVSTQQLLVWPAVSDAPAVAAASVWDFDLDSAGNLLSVDQGIDNIRKRTAAGTWSTPASDGDGTQEPNILWEPVSGNWILAFSRNPTDVVVRTSSNLWTTRTDRVAPTFPATARVTMGHNGAGRVVMQGFSGTNTYFSYSDDGGVTWSAPSTHALGFTYSTAGTSHHPRPVFNGKAWVAVGMNVTTGVSSVFTSSDGATWSAGPAFSLSAIRHIAGVGGLVVGTTMSATTALSGGLVLSADNGATWHKTEGTYVFSSVQPRGIVATKSRFVLLASARVFPGVGILDGGGLVT